MTIRPLFDANATAGGRNLGNLPEWDLSDLYSAPDAPEVARDLDWLEQACADFARDYEGKLGTLHRLAAQVPAEVLNTFPRVQLELAWSIILEWRFDDASALIDR